MSRPATPGGTVSTLTMQPVVRALRQLNIDPDRIFGVCGVALQLVDDPHARLPASAEVAVWETLVSATGDPLIGLRLADEIARGALGAYEYALRNSPTLRHAFALGSRYMQVIDDRAELAVVETDGLASVRLGHLNGSPHPPAGVECTFAVAARVLRAGGGERGRPVEVQFRHRALGPAAEYEARFACPVRFECAHNAGVFAVSLLDLSNPNADPRLLEVLEEQLARALRELPAEAPWVQQARAQLEQLMAAGNTSLPGLAAALHMSTRTLRRHLAQHATSYSDLLDDVRRDVALFYVRHTREGFDQIAGRLGFADASAFYRAFRRWHDMTPAAFRTKGAATDLAPGHQS